MMKAIAGAALGAALTMGAAAQGQLRPIEDFIAPPSVTNVNLSPSGRYFTAVTLVDNQRVLAVFDSEALDVAPVGIGIDSVWFQWVAWASDERLLVNVYDGLHIRYTTYHAYIEQQFRTIAFDRDGTNMVTLFDGVDNDGRRSSARDRNIGSLTDILRNDPQHVLMPGVRGDDVDLFRVNIYTGAAERIERGRTRTLGWVTDSDGVPVLRIDTNRNVSLLRYYSRRRGSSRWSHLMTVRERDRREFWPVAAGDNPGEVYAIARPNDAQRAGVYMYNVDSEAFGAPIATHPRVDIQSALIHSESGRYLGAAFVDDRLEYDFVDPELAAHFDGLDGFFGPQANIRVRGSNEAGTRLLLHVTSPQDAGSYNLYDVEDARVTRIADINPALAEFGAQVEVVRYPARDGASITAYLTLPDAPAGSPPPLVVMPHGGPEVRDQLGFDLYAQFLASRGYAVLQPNFRGSSGYGMSFMHAGRREWGGLVQNDITDGVQHLINLGRVDAERICIFGASFGGYAALAGAAFTPERYQCAIGLAGAYGLEEFLEWQRSTHGNASEEYAYWQEVIGRPNADRERLRAASPSRHAANITIPVLLIHGETDDIVPASQSVLMQNALRAAGREVRYISVEGVGHSYWASQHEARAMREIELFLARHIGGRTGPEPAYMRLAAIDEGVPPWLAREDKDD